MDEIDNTIAELCDLERERLTGWQGPGGAAYNAISEDLCEAGLLDRHWNLTQRGEAIAARLKAQEKQG